MIQTLETGEVTEIETLLTNYAKVNVEDDALMPLMMAWFGQLNNGIHIEKGVQSSDDLGQTAEIRLREFIHELAGIFPDLDQTILLHQLWLAVRNTIEKKKAETGPVIFRRPHRV